MSGFNVADMLKVAKEEGLSGGEKLANGNYVLRAAFAQEKSTQAGSPKISVKWQVEEGPYAGQTAWENVNFPPSAPASQSDDDVKKWKTRIAIFMGRLKSLGVSDEFLETNPSVKDIADSIVGVVVETQVGEKNGWQTFKTLRIVEEAVPTLGATAAPASVPSFLQGVGGPNVAPPMGSFLGAQTGPQN